MFHIWLLRKGRIFTADKTKVASYGQEWLELVAQYTVMKLSDVWTAAQACLDQKGRLFFIMPSIQVRYFASRHSVDEDSITGSAMRILAEFWASTINHLRAHQCSARDGYLNSYFQLLR